MTHPQLLALNLMIAIVLGCGPAHAQQQSSTAENVKTDAAPLREKAFNLLESLADEINSLQSAENRARLGSNIAASLLKYDEKRARTLLVSVEDDINAGLQISESDDPTCTQTLMVFLKLRMDTVERIAKLDGELALEFLQATELSSDRRLPYDVAEGQRALELRLAKEIADNNPEIALKLGRHSLVSGFSNHVVSLLTQLNRKHKEQALILYKEIVFKLQNVNLARDWSVRYFALNLAQSFTPPVADNSAFRELINLFNKSASANGCGNKMLEEDDRAEFCRWITSLVRQMERVDSFRNPQDSSHQAFSELTELTQNGTVDEILAVAAKYPQYESEIYWQAIQRAETIGDNERARKLATDYGGDPEKRRLMLARIDHDQKWASMNDEKLAELQSTLSRIPRIQERFGFLLSVVNQIPANDRKTALMLLNQASGIVDSMKPGTEQTEAQMRLAIMYCLVKSERGFEIMETMVPKLNDLVAAAAKLDGYDTRYLREGEWNMSAEGIIGSLLTQLAQNAGYFAWSDFDRAVSLAAQFERPELRLMAQLKLAQAILTGPRRRWSVTSAMEY